MTDNRTTKLREKLTERGVEWIDESNGYADVTTFIANGVKWTVISKSYLNPEHDWMTMNAERITPEQAIAATLGRPKVKKVRGLTYDEHGGEVYYLACSGCGDWVDGDLDCIGEADGPNFCHNCGGEFDGPLLCKVCGELADMEFGDMCAECYWHEGEGNDER